MVFNKKSNKIFEEFIFKNLNFKIWRIFISLIKHPFHFYSNDIILFLFTNSSKTDCSSFNIITISSENINVYEIKNVLTIIDKVYNIHHLHLPGK